MKKESLNTKKGFSLVEAVVAVGIFSIITGYAISVMVSSNKYIRESGNQYRATALAEEGLEAVRNIRDNAFTNLVDNTYGISSSGSNYAFSGSQDVKDIFTRKVYVSTIDSTTKEIKSEIVWTDSGVNKKVSLSEQLTNWRKTKNINPISKWSFDENSGCTAHDSVGNNDGALMPDTCPTDSPLWISGKVGVSALRFNSTSHFNYVRVSDNNALDLSTSGTIMAWIYPTTSSVMGIVHKGSATSGSDEAYYFRMDNSRLLTGGGRNSSNTQVSVQTTSAISINTWTHVTFTWDPTGMKIYINGALRTNANTTVLNARNSSGSLQIGIYYPTLQTNRFRERIDEVSLYNTALSASEILTIYNSQK